MTQSRRNAERRSRHPRTEAAALRMQWRRTWPEVAGMMPLHDRPARDPVGRTARPTMAITLAEACMPYLGTRILERLSEGAAE